MAFDEYLVERIRQRLPNKKIEGKKMMGGWLFMVNNKMCIGVDKDKKSGKDRMMLRVGKEAYEKLLKKKGAREMDFTGRSMKGFLFVYPEGFDADKDLDFWVKQALAFNAELVKDG